MDYKKLFTDQSTIKVSVMTVDGKKLTKSLVEQLPYHFPFDKHFNFQGQKIFGHVKVGKATSNNPRAENIRFVIFEKDEKLYKFAIDRLHSMSTYGEKTSLDDFSTRALKELLGDNVEYYKSEESNSFNWRRNFDGDATIEDFLSPVGLEKFTTIKSNVKSLYLEILDHQIFV